jgi:thermitase
MKTISTLKIIIVLFLMSLFSLPVKPLTSFNYAPDRIIVKFRTNVSFSISTNKDRIILFNINALDKLNAKYACVRVKNIGPKKPASANHAIYTLEFAGNPDIQQLIKDYLNTGLFIYAEPDFKGGIQGKPGSDSIMPNDPFFYRQWSLYNNGTFSSPLPVKIDADIDMNKAWAVEQGDTSMVVGIIDTGLKLDHPEFSGRIWLNNDEVQGNGIDDDGNLYTDDMHGWDFANSDNDPTDDEGHGTNVSGIIGANGNNSIGYAGVDWKCKLMILKAINSANWGYYSWWIDAIHYAVDNGARAINMSVCGTSASSPLQDGVNYALQHNVTIIACMGNENNNTPNYPAAYDGVIAVGSTNPDDTRSNPFFWSATSGSNFNSYISVVGPGNYIYGLNYLNNNSYDTYWGGTSQATPHVTGLVSLLLAQNSTRTPAELKDIIEKTSQDQVGNPAEDTPGWDQYYGWGRINAYSALTYHPSEIEDRDNSLFTVFPNPSSGRFFVSCKTIGFRHLEIEITNLFGQVVLRQSMVIPQSEINISNQAKGVYFVTIHADQVRQTVKLFLK